MKKTLTLTLLVGTRDPGLIRPCQGPRHLDRLRRPPLRHRRRRPRSAGRDPRRPLGHPAHLCRQRATTCSSCRASTPRATGSGRSTSGASAASACSPTDFGPAYVEQDRAARLFLYRGDMDAEWAAYGPKREDAIPRPSSPASTPMSPTCARARAAAGRVQARRHHARPVDGRGRRAHPQPWR